MTENSGPADDQLDGGEMTMICAWCKVMIREGPGAISHGICLACSARLHMDIDAESLVT